MGGSSKQVIGHRYFTNFLLFIGNPIEKVLGINFDKRGWLSPFVNEDGNALTQGVIDSPNLYGENEGGVAGVAHVQYGRDDQEVLSFYKDYMASLELPASAYPFQSYLGFTGLSALDNNAFYVGNSGYMKEMLLWPKRIHVRNDGRAQWYDIKAEIADTVITGSKSEYIDDNGPISPSLRYDVEQLEINYKRSGEAENFPFGDGVGSNIAQGIVDDYEQNIKFRISGDDLNRFDLYKVSILLPYHVREFSVEIPPGLTILSQSITDVTDDYPESETEKWKYLRVEYVCYADSHNIGVNVKAKGGVHRDTDPPNSGKFEYYIQASIGKVKSVSAPIYADSGDINPIHKIREILTDDTAMSKPESFINDVNFIKAADRIYDEALGISWAITDKSCIDAINELCYHIEAGIRINRQTGLYEVVLFRDDWFEEDEVHTISESKIKSIQYEITNADEVINQVNVNFYDRVNIKNSSFSISENGLIQTLNLVNAETVDFPYFMNMRNAEIVANWKLKILSTGVLKGSFTTGWREARKWNRYDLIRLPWSKRWTGTILVRIMSIKLGGPTSNEVSIDFIEVVPATGMMNTTIVADDPIDKPLPPQACQYEPFELPYYLAAMLLGQRKADEELAYESNFGLVGVVAEKPQENSIYAVMMTNNYDEWVRAGSIQYSQTADSDQVISKTSTSFTVKNWKKIANVPVGTLIQCGKEWLTGFVEWMVFQGVDPDTGVISVKRGALDTQPQQWDSGLKLYFCGTDVAYDATEYVADEKVLVSALTTTPSGVLEQKGSNLVEMKARAIRPYPPANVKINGEYWPIEIETDLIITWVDRNRVQQTGGEILGWFDGGVMIEPGTSTHLILTEYDENNVELATNSVNVSGANTYTFPISSVQPDSRTIKITLKTLRNGYACLNPFVHTVELSQFFSAPYDLTVEFKND